MKKQNNIDVCQEQSIHRDVVENIKNKMISNELLLELSDLFKIMGDHTRVRIIHALCLSELCVCDLVVILEISQSAASHQLRILRASKLVKYRKEGKNVYYSIDDDHVFTLINQGTRHVKEQKADSSGFH